MSLRRSVLWAFLCALLCAPLAWAARASAGPLALAATETAAPSAEKQGISKSPLADKGETKPGEKSPDKAEVRFAERALFSFQVPLGEQSAQERARAANQAFKTAFDHAPEGDLRAVAHGEQWVLFFGDAPVASFTQADADAAHAVSLDAHVKGIVATCAQVVAEELKRKSIANTVLSFSLVVFLAFVALYLLRTVRDVANRLSAGLARMPDSKLSIQVRNIEVLSPGMWRKLVELVLAIAPWVVQVGIGYTWLLVVLSLFEATKGYTERLTLFVLSPLVQLTEVFASTVPLLVLMVFAGIALLVVTRFIKLFFLSVARGVTVVRGVSPDLALPISVVLRVGLVVAALVFAAPVLTGSADSSLGRTGMLALVMICIAATPVLASALVGAFVIFGRKLKVNDYVQIGGQLGRITSLELLEIQLQSPEGTLLRVPHLKTLWTPTEVFGPWPQLVLTVPVAASTPASTAWEALHNAAQELGSNVQVALISADSETLHFRICFNCQDWTQRSQAHAHLLDRLVRANVTLGRGTP
ncbi:MAG TPA: mechanosensitive ion channel domain-containing protein [Polyangiaceae bacterium]|nr:mechanosensitive ion channel domain-containing protein [Polyangiaceae bacterium]